MDEPEEQFSDGQTDHHVSFPKTKTRNMEGYPQKVKSDEKVARGNELGFPVFGSPTFRPLGVARVGVSRHTTNSIIVP